MRIGWVILKDFTYTIAVFGLVVLREPCFSQGLPKGESVPR